VVDEIKAAVDKACKRPVVSCADILAIAARDSVSIVSFNPSHTNLNFILTFMEQINYDIARK